MKELSLLALLLVLGGPAGAQEDAREPARRHILHLESGRILRGKARLVPSEQREQREQGEGGESGEVWEIRLRGTTERVPAARVVRAVLEKDVLAEARSLERKVGQEPAHRVAYGEWCLRAGLVNEGLHQLDLVLARHEDQPDALAALRRTRPESDLLAIDPGQLSGADAPQVLQAFLRQAAGLRPAARELAVLELGDLQGQSGVYSGVYGALRDELEAASVRRRRFAAHAMRRLFPGREIRTLLRRAILDGSRDVRHEACLALRDAEEPAVILPAIKALGSSSIHVRTGAAEALGNMGYPHAVEALVAHLAAVQSPGAYAAPRANIFVGTQIAYVQDYDVEIAQGASIADPIVNVITSGSVLDVRVLGAHLTTIVAERRAVRSSLAQLTGASPGKSASAWADWWAENAADWTNLDAEKAGPETPAR